MKKNWLEKEEKLRHEKTLLKTSVRSHGLHQLQNNSYEKLLNTQYKSY